MSEDPYSGERSVVPAVPVLLEPAPLLRTTLTLAALGLVLGVAGAAALPFGLLRLHQGSIAGDPRVYLLDADTARPSLDAMWLYFSSSAGVALALLLLIGSAGAIRFQSWARPTLLLWAIASLLLAVAGIPFYYRWLFAPFNQSLAQVRGDVDVLSNLGGMGLGTPLAAALLILLTRPSVKAAFAHQESRAPLAP